MPSIYFYIILTLFIVFVFVRLYFHYKLVSTGDLIYAYKKIGLDFYFMFNFQYITTFLSLLFGILLYIASKSTCLISLALCQTSIVGGDSLNESSNTPLYLLENTARNPAVFVDIPHHGDTLTVCVVHSIPHIYFCPELGYCFPYQGNILPVQVVYYEEGIQIPNLYYNPDLGFCGFKLSYLDKLVGNKSPSLRPHYWYAGAYLDGKGNFCRVSGPDQPQVW